MTKENLDNPNITNITPFPVDGTSRLRPGDLLDIINSALSLVTETIGETQNSNPLTPQFVPGQTISPFIQGLNNLFSFDAIQESSSAIGSSENTPEVSNSLDQTQRGRSRSLDDITN